MRYALPLLVLGSFPLPTGEDLVKNGDFSQGLAHWSEAASDARREVTVTKLEGKNVLQLRRKAAEAQAIAAQWNLKLKPETLYRLSVTGRGENEAFVSLRPQSSRDKSFEQLLKAWAVTTGPLPASKEDVTQTLLFDSGLKPQSAYVNLGLGGKEPGVYYVSRVAFEEVGPSQPDKDETVILHIGDSFTATSYLPFNDRIQARLDSLLRKDFPGRRFRQINVGVDGEFVKDLLDTKRYDVVIKDNYQKVDIAVIRYGANDANRYDAKEFRTLLGTLCDNLERNYPGIHVVLGTGTYLYGNPNGVNDRYLPYWQAARDLAAERKYPLIDVCAAFQAEKSSRATRGDADMHPSAAGVILTAETEYKVLKPLMEASSPKK